jgi:hypothetical protein
MLTQNKWFDLSDAKGSAVLSSPLNRRTILRPPNKQRLAKLRELDEF